MIWQVICLDDAGTYRLATSKEFKTERDAQAYAATVAQSRKPIVFYKIVREFYA